MPGAELSAATQPVPTLLEGDGAWPPAAVAAASAWGAARDAQVVYDKQ